MLDSEKEYYKNKDNSNDDKRISLFVDDLCNANEALSKSNIYVTIFGGSRLDRNSVMYEHIVLLSKELSKFGFAIMTGGSSGVMEAANKGAENSIGLSIKLPNEQKTNAYVKEEVSFHYFSSRKMSFIKHSSAFICCPGGFGTLDELFEILCLAQTKKIQNKPIVLFGKEYFSHIEPFFKMLVQENHILEEYLELFFITDSIKEAIEYINRNIS
jgi:uncharacterized protein (TIGR00730 family)